MVSKQTLWEVATSESPDPTPIDIHRLCYVAWSPQQERTARGRDGKWIRNQCSVQPRESEESQWPPSALALISLLSPCCCLLNAMQKGHQP